MFLLLLFFCFTQIIATYRLPPGLKLCHRSQPDFADCVRQHMGDGIRIFAKGYDKLGIKRLEPYRIESMEINNNRAQAASVTQKYWNIDVYGITGTDVLALDIDLDDKCFWNATALTPLLRLQGDYQLQGKLLIFPVNGKGKCNITLEALRNHHYMTCEKYTKRGQTFIRVLDYKMTIDTENVIFELTNLIPGNPEISKEVLKTLNENPIMIFKEVQKGYADVFAKIHFDNTNQVFSKIPMNEMFLD